MKRLLLTSGAIGVLGVGCLLDRGGRLDADTGVGGAASSTSTSGGSATGGAPTGVGGMFASVGGSSAGGMPPAGGTGGVGGAVGSGGAGGGATCPTGAGPNMVRIAHPSGDFCIDSTEVTSLHYKAFLDAAPTLSLPSACNFKSGHTPRSSGASCESKHYDPVGFPNRPVACVDWCDAHAFCAWAGKRMCGRADGAGGVPFSDAADANRSEWFHACSNGGTRTFPYGNTYGPTTCVGDDYDGVSGDGSSDEAIDVGTATACQGGFAGLWDMSGNVWEWENSCDPSGTSADNQCHTRGGSFWDGEDPSLLCTGVGPTNHTRSSFNKNIGFRCCADPL